MNSACFVNGKVYLGGALITMHKVEMSFSPIVISPNTTLDDAISDVIEATLAHHNGDRHAAAKTLGICVKTIYNRTRKAR
jgi:DNA-binding NtrC family response regulator